MTYNLLSIKKFLIVNNISPSSFFIASKLATLLDDEVDEDVVGVGDNEGRWI